MTLKLSRQALKSYLKITREFKLHTLPNKKVTAANDYGDKSSDRPWYAIFSVIVYTCFFWFAYL